MPRGVSKSYEVRIEEVDAKIAKVKATLSDLKAIRKDLEAQKQAELLTKVEVAAAKKGVSVEDLLKSVLK